jgi:fibronectin type 3 domain-containing protein
MGWFRPLSVWLVLLSLLALASCGTGTSPVSDLTGNQGPQNTGAIPSIWDLDNSARGVSLVGGDSILTVTGDQHLPELIYNGTVVETDAILDSGAGGDRPVAWAVYAFSDLHGKRPKFLNTFGTVGGLEHKYYVGLSNFTEGNWEWFGPSQLPELQIDLRETFARYISASGNMYFLVVVEGGDVVTHHKTQLTYALGDGDLLPGAPSRLQATDGEFADKIVVTWEPGHGADSYELYRRLDGSEEEFTLIAETDNTEFVDTTAEAGKFYLYKARSKNEAGFSGFSNKDSGYRGDIPHEGDCPAELWASDGTYAEKVRLEWMGSANASYKVWRKKDGTAEFDHIGMSDGNSFNDTTADPGVVYIYKVSILSEGEQCYSNTDSGYRGEGGNEACPHEVWASDGTYADKVRIEWSGVAGSWYKIYRQPLDGGDYVHIGGTDSQLSFNDMEAEAGVHYNYKVILVENEQFVCHGTDVGYKGGGTGEEDCPSELVATDGLYPDKVRLEWNGNVNRGYDIFRKVDGQEGEFEFLAYVGGNSYNDTAVEPGVTYLYKVGLEREGGFCFSNIDSGYVSDDNGEENCPSELSASDGTNENGVVLEWLGVAGEPYQIWRRVDGSDNWDDLAVVESLEYLDETAEAGVTYIYKIKHATQGCVSNQDAGHRGGGDQ